jgi:hypothetical protein
MQVGAGHDTKRLIGPGYRRTVAGSPQNRANASIPVIRRLPRVSEGLVALVPVGVAALLIAFCLAGAQLYASSAGSAALGTQLDETCRADSALVLPIPSEVARGEQRVAEIGRAVPFVDPPRRRAVATPFLSDSAVPRRFTVLAIDGVDRDVTPALTPLGPDEIAMSDAIMREQGLAVGDTVAVAGASLRITQSFQHPPINPLPSFWCGYPDLLVPPPSGDIRPPWAIASPATVAGLGGSAFDEYRVVERSLTLTDAAALRQGFAQAMERWRTTFPISADGLERNELTRVVERAMSVQRSVQRNLAPVTLTGVVAGAIVLVAAGVLLARDRQRELRLLAVRGTSPARIAWHVTPRLACAIGAGSVVGWFIGWLLISMFGPSSHLEMSALTRSVAWVGAAAVLALALVAGVVAFVGDGFADARVRRVHHRWIGLAAVVGVVALAVGAFRVLDREGGLRTFGVESRGGNLLAMGFPLFALLAMMAIGGLVVAAVAPRLRLTGRSLRRWFRLGWRRVVLDSGPLVAVVVSAGLAAGCFTVASALAAGAERQLADKAMVYVGSDLSVDVYDPVSIPSAWSGRATVVTRTRVKYGETRADLLGIDRAEFADVAKLRHDGASRSLDELVAEIEPSSDLRLRAIGVGGDFAIGDVIPIEVPGTTDAVPVTIAATADFFPTKITQVPLLVVDIDAANSVSRFARDALLMRDPPSDAVTEIRAQGVRTGLVRDVTRAFDGSAYSALRWAYAPLAALGVLFAIVALALQLLVVSARRSQRRVADAVMRRTGFTTRGLWWASVVEVGVPLVVGSAIGVAAAAVAARLSIVRLDPMPGVAPPAEFVMPWNVLIGVACVVPIWTALMAAAIVRSTVRADPMRVFQGAG